jgi:hypothetical protein
MQGQGALKLLAPVYAQQHLAPGATQAVGTSWASTDRS